MPDHLLRTDEMALCVMSIDDNAATAFSRWSGLSASSTLPTVHLCRNVTPVGKSDKSTLGFTVGTFGVSSVVVSQRQLKDGPIPRPDGLILCERPLEVATTGPGPVSVQA